MSTKSKTMRTRRSSWVLALVTAASLAAIAVACEGGQAGDKCTTNSDCNTSLICQPIAGRNGDFCCGAYGPDMPTTNIPENCQPFVAGGGSGTGSGSGTSPPADAAAGG
jgi:hypothetical protein